MITLNWVKCTGDQWCSLERVNLASLRTTGVYIIWHKGNPGRVVRVGQGNIADRLTDHSKDARVLAYRRNGDLRVTWAAAPAHLIDGIERYLSDHWKPLLGDRFPDVAPIAVNSPFAA